MRRRRFANDLPAIRASRKRFANGFLAVADAHPPFLQPPRSTTRPPKRLPPATPCEFASSESLPRRAPFDFASPKIASAMAFRPRTFPKPLRRRTPFEIASPKTAAVSHPVRIRTPCNRCRQRPRTNSRPGNPCRARPRALPPALGSFRSPVPPPPAAVTRPRSARTRGTSPSAPRTATARGHRAAPHRPRAARPASRDRRGAHAARAGSAWRAAAGR